jgi:hypothetical protein
MQATVNETAANFDDFASHCSVLASLETMHGWELEESSGEEPMLDDFQLSYFP